MSDLTDSYCERCGARYVFSPPAPKALSFKGARVLAKGLKNFVLTDGQSMADSLTLARHDDDHEDSSRMTEAFHRTFNFCMTCRQYACDRCWNARTGACLSCSPEEGYEPVAPVDHMIVRTPVAQWDADWSLFPDGPAVEPLVRPAPPVPFDAPILFSELERTVAEAQPAIPSEPAVRAEAAPEAAWPVADLPADATSVPVPQASRGNHRPYHKPVDPQAASLWPLADEIAPEMTLTPEELELVEFRLAHEGPDEMAAETDAALEPAPVTEPADGPEIVADAAAEPAALPANHRPVEELASPIGWLSGSAQWPPLGSLDPEPEPDDSALLPILGQPAEPDPWALDLERDRQTPPTRILKMPTIQPLAAPAKTEPKPVVPPRQPANEDAQQLPQAPVHEPNHEHAPIVGRLLGRHGKRDAQNAGEPWPHATPWTDRPLPAQNWFSEVDVAADEVAVRTAAHAAAPAPLAAPVPSAPAPALQIPAPTAEPATQPERGQPRPIAPQAQSGLVDSRSAAAVRLAAVSDYAAEPAPVTAPEAAPASPPSQPALFDLPPAPPAARKPLAPEPPAWPEADREVAAAARARSSKEAERTQEPRTAGPVDEPAVISGPFRHPAASPEPSAPWQPLGTSWPADQSPNAPWPGPGLPSVLSVVAAQQTNAPIVTEMWAQSSQEVLNHGTVRVCHRCALPVSTQARFCRRCGTEQG
jgi:hypothetical protein